MFTVSCVIIQIDMDFQKSFPSAQNFQSNWRMFSRYIIEFAALKSKPVCSTLGIKASSLTAGMGVDFFSYYLSFIIVTYVCILFKIKLIVNEHFNALQMKKFWFLF